MRKDKIRKYKINQSCLNCKYDPEGNDWKRCRRCRRNDFDEWEYGGCYNCLDLRAEIKAITKSFRRYKKDAQAENKQLRKSLERVSKLQIQKNCSTCGFLDDVMSHKYFCKITKKHYDKNHCCKRWKITKEER